MKFVLIVFFIAIVIFADNCVVAQVGINTSDPRGLFEVVSKSDSKSIVFTNEGNLGIGTITPKTKLDVEGTMTILKSSPQENINNYLLISDAEGSGLWGYSGIPLQNKVSSFNIELETTSLFAETRFKFASEDPVIRNELNFRLDDGFFALHGVPRGYYAIICNFELVNANSTTTVALSLTSTRFPMQGNIYGYQTVVGKKLSGGSWFVNFKGGSTDVIYLVLLARSMSTLSDWKKDFTYWDKPTVALPNGELFKIKGRIDIIKLG